MPRKSMQVLLAVVAAAGATVLSSGTAFAQGSSHTAAPAPVVAPHLISPSQGPNPPPDCDKHPTFPGCKKKPVGG
jgi:hypothetical protein